MTRTAAALAIAIAVMMSSRTAAVAVVDASKNQDRSTSKPAMPLGTHAVRGIVRSVDARSLVIARSLQRSSDMTFVLRPSTEREGTIAAGAIVSVRYIPEDHTLIATAVFVQSEPAHAGHR
jgi:hypothetical protein